MDDTSKSIECLCHFMTTVGGKLDTNKAKVCMYPLYVKLERESVCVLGEGGVCYWEFGCLHRYDVNVCIYHK